MGAILGMRMRMFLMSYRKVRRKAQVSFLSIDGISCFSRFSRPDSSRASLVTERERERERERESPECCARQLGCIRSVMKKNGETTLFFFFFFFFNIYNIYIHTQAKKTL